MAAIKLPFGLGLTLGRSAPAAPNPAADEEPIPPGPFDRRRGDREVGATGVRNYGGFLEQEEYNADLKGKKAIEVYTKMAASDSMVTAMLRSIVLPLRGAIPKVEPASDDPQDVLIAKACEAALLNMKGQLFDDFLRQAFTGTLTFGHSVFEQVYSDAEGNPNLVELDIGGKTVKVIAPYKLAPRLQRTIYRWPTDRNGDLVGIVQQVFVSDLKPGTEMQAGGNVNAALAGGKFEYIPIPADRLMVFVLEQEGSNWLGRSILRSAYRDYTMKGVLLNIAAIGFERHFVGTPYAIVKQGVRGAEEQALVNMLSTLRSHEKGFAIANEAQLADYAKTGMHPIGFLDMPTLGTSGRAILDQIKYHDQQMATSILAEFLTMGGQGAAGAYAMHRDKSSLFFNSLQGIKRPFEDSFTHQVMIPFIDLNFGPQQKYPTFGLSSLETKDLAQWGRGLALMAQAELITPDPDLENTLREMMDFPLLPTDATGDPVYPVGTHLPPPPSGPGTLRGAPPPERPTTPRPDGTSPTGNQPMAGTPLSELTFTAYRPLREAEKVVNFGDLEATMNRGSDALSRAAKPAAIALAQQMARNESHSRAQERMARAFRGPLRDIYAKGYEQVQAEHRRSSGQRNNAAPPRLPEADVGDEVGLWEIAQAMADRVTGRIRDWFTRHADDPEFDAEAEADAIAESSLDAVAGYSASTPLNQGRAAAADDLHDQIASVEWSSLLDKETCDYCEGQDGETFGPDDAPDIPDGNCDGGDNCRCVAVYVFADEGDGVDGE